MKPSFRNRPIVHGLALAAFACRALVPVGFMPAALDSGGPIVLCPGGSGGAIVRFLAQRAAGDDAHHSRHEHVPDSYEAWEYCPIGVAFSAAALTAAIDFQLPILDHALEAVDPTRLIDRLVIRRYQARAPPVL